MKISVVIPTFNRERTIKRAIDSVLNQTHPVDEIIVVDDGSSDGTEEVVAGISDSRIRFVKLPENRGPGGARNEGVRLASGDWVAFHDSDDVWHSDKIEKQLACLEEHPDRRFIYCAYYFVATGNTMPLLLGYDRYDGDIVSLLLPQNLIGAPTMFFEKSLYEEVGGFSEEMRALEDWDLAIKMALKTEVGFVPEALMDVYVEDAGVSQDRAAYALSLCYILGKYKKQYLEYNLFNNMVLYIMETAKKLDIEAQIERVLTLYLSQ